MKPAPFDIRRPVELDEVLALLAEHREAARLIAGGQSLVPLMNLRMATPELLVDLNRVQGLSGIRVDGEWIRIGAMTRQREILGHPLLVQHAPLLTRAAPFIGHVQTRSRGTVGGSLAHADPSAELPVTMVALDAVLTARSARGERTIPAREFFEDILTTRLDPTEVLVEIAVRAAPKGTRASFREFARRHGDFAIASCAAQFVPGADGPRLDIALGGVGPVPHYCSRLCTALAGSGFSRDGIEHLVADEVAALDPLSDLQADADYRRTLATVVLIDCLKEVLP
jgi:CO/xanthine dehydrogenase FAD-binding subunit